MLTERTDRT